MILLVACTPAPAASPMTTVGIVAYSATTDPVLNGFKEGMADLGYVEGENITYVYNGVTPPDGLNAEIQKLVDQDIKYIFTMGTPPTETAKTVVEGTDVSVVFAPFINPVEAGLVADQRNPGGRLTGVNTGGDVVGKGLEWLVTVVPTAETIYVPYREEDPNAALQFDALEAAAEELGVELVLDKVASPEEAIERLDEVRGDIDAVFLIPLLTADADKLRAFVTSATELGLPVGADSATGNAAGALAAVAPTPGDVGRQAARLMDQIIKGANVGDVPIEQAQYSFHINMITAEALGLEIPETVLQKANDIIRPTEAP
jgi:putative ABC transport system substrate-binding protein